MHMRQDGQQMRGDNTRVRDDHQLRSVTLVRQSKREEGLQGHMPRQVGLGLVTQWTGELRANQILESKPYYSPYLHKP